VIEKPSQPVTAMQRTEKAKTVESSKPWVDDSDDEGLSYFEKLAEED
jgi:hypothetical protein